MRAAPKCDFPIDFNVKVFWSITFVIDVWITEPRRFILSIISQKEFDIFYCMSHTNVYMQVPPIGPTFNLEWTVESLFKYQIGYSTFQMSFVFRRGQSLYDNDAKTCDSD